MRNRALGTECGESLSWSLVTLMGRAGLRPPCIPAQLGNPKTEKGGLGGQVGPEEPLLWACERLRLSEVGMQFWWPVALSSPAPGTL